MAPADIEKLSEQEKRKLAEQSINTLNDVNRTLEQRKEAISDLIIIGDSIAVEPLIQALKDNDWELRVSAAEALHRFPDVRSIEPLLEVALNDANIFVRTEAAMTLRYIKDEKAVRALIEVFKVENMDLRPAAANSLVKFGELSVLPLLEMLDTASTSMLYWIIYLLARIGDKRAVKHLSGLIKNKDSEMRKYIISYLSDFEDEDILPFLFELQNAEPDEAVRVTIAQVIEELQEQDSE